MSFLGMGPLEILLILILGFLFFGPEKLPQVAAKAGKLYRSFRKATFDLSKSITSEVDSEGKTLKEDLSEISKSFSKDLLSEQNAEKDRQDDSNNGSMEVQEETISSGESRTNKDK
jgi:TatA/E family protein of Tat protein translocase